MGERVWEQQVWAKATKLKRPVLDPITSSLHGVHCSSNNIQGHPDRLSGEVGGVEKGMCLCVKCWERGEDDGADSPTAREEFGDWRMSTKPGEDRCVEDSCDSAVDAPVF